MKPESTGKNSNDTVIEFLPDADEIERRPLPRLARTTLYALASMLVLFLLWATFFKVDRVVVAHGRIITPLPDIVVQPLETAIIQSIDVQVGQVVKKGQKLATLDSTFAEADQAELKNHIASLDNQTERLKAELSGKNPPLNPHADADTKMEAELSSERQANYKAQMEKLNETIAGLRAALDTNKHDQQILETRVKSLQEIENMQEKLVAQQFGARVHLLEARDKRLEVERDMDLAKNREQELKRQLAASEAEKSAFELTWRQKMMEDLLAAAHDRDTQSEQLLKANRRHKLVTLVAPTDSVVLEIAKLSQGSVIREAETLFTLVQLDTTLESEVQIDSIDTGYVKVGDTARLKLDAFPFQKHGTLTGQIQTISEDAFRRDNQGNPSLLAQGTDAFYLSRITFGKSKLKNMPEQAKLLPGMTLTAEIVVGQRSVISYLLWPLGKAVDESIGEP
ncbi:MAG TPA: HlyD family type I secretion periplasmic adaptor subunit [Burkholderiaceae bacterium]|nr:HlyD family type I secretion periplasmic adaptor subunit [Burkholderiaceae bacterium]